jgi:UDP-N-acetyl-D-galactosamine dehydrogenase
VVDIVQELESFGMEVLVHDPLADAEEAKEHYSITLSPWEELVDLGALIVSVAHEAYRKTSVPDYVVKLVQNGCIVDVKSMIDPAEVRELPIKYWRL